jgi:hypothetical protein
MKKKGVLLLALQLIVFIRCECLQTNHMSYRITIHHIYDAIHCNSIITLLKQLNFNYCAIPL